MRSQKEFGRNTFLSMLFHCYCFQLILINDLKNTFDPFSSCNDTRHSSE